MKSKQSFERKLKTTTVKKALLVWMEPETKAKLAAKSKHIGVRQSAFVRGLLEDYFR